MKKYLILLLGLMMAGQIAFSQPVRGIKTEAKKATAQEQLEKTDYANAEIWANKALQDDKKDADMKRVLAFSLFYQRDYKRAETRLKSVVNSNARKNINPNDRFYLAMAMKMNGKYDEAEAEFESFIQNGTDEKLLKLAEVELDGIKLYRDSQADPSVIVENLGKGVNTAHTDLAPFPVSATEIYYTALNADEPIELDLGDVNATKQSQSDVYTKIFTATKNGDKWEKGGEVGEGVNKFGYHNVHTAISQDGGTLYFSRCELVGNTEKCDIYMSSKSNGQWGEAVKIEGGTNGEGFSSKQPAVGSINGKEAIFFSSDMPNGNGGLDIYYAVKQNGSVFGAPVNLGNTVNTIGDEVTPFARENTIYFSSDGHPGMGGKDIFSATQNGVKFGGVKNMGATLNSSVDDWYYSIDDTGYNGFFVSNRSGGVARFQKKSATCCYDIWSVTYPLPVIVNINAKTVDNKTGEPLNGVTVMLVNMNTSETDSKTNERSNNFPWDDVAKETEYKLVASRDGYIDTFVVVSTKEIEASTTLEALLTMRPVPPPPPPPEVVIELPDPEKPIRLGNIYFKFDSKEILEESFPQLDQLVELMRDFPDITKIELSAHTDARGNDDYNQRLSQRRAQEAAQYLINKGIDPARITFIGKGEAEIINHCKNGVKCSEEEHLINRRVEFRILEGRRTVPAKYFLEHESN